MFGLNNFQIKTDAVGIKAYQSYSGEVYNLESTSNQCSSIGSNNMGIYTNRTQVNLQSNNLTGVKNGIYCDDIKSFSVVNENQISYCQRGIHVNNIIPSGVYSIAVASNNITNTKKWNTCS